MTAATGKYFRDQHLLHVMQAGRMAGLKGAALAVLSYLCDASQFKRPTVCVSKATIAGRTGYCEKTVKAALRVLRASGLLTPIAYETGGRERATVYKLTTKAPNGGENLPPNYIDPKRGEVFSRKGGKNFPERGEKTYPPSISSSISSSRGERTASSGGGFRPLLDAARGGSPQGAQDDPDLAREQAALAEYNRAISLCDGNIGRAWALVDQWREERLAAAKAGEIA